MKMQINTALIQLLNRWISHLHSMVAKNNIFTRAKMYTHTHTHTQKCYKTLIKCDVFTAHDHKCMSVSLWRSCADGEKAWRAFYMVRAWYSLRN